MFDDSENINVAHLYKNSEHSNEMEQIRIAAGLRIGVEIAQKL